jgi:hypothetical protein
MSTGTKSWPDRYAVTLTSAEDESSEYAVTSWQSEEKAIALAVVKHTLSGGKPIYRVTVRCLGPTPRDASGVVDIPHGDLVDRMEW